MEIFAQIVTSEFTRHFYIQLYTHVKHPQSFSQKEPQPELKT